MKAWVQVVSGYLRRIVTSFRTPLVTIEYPYAARRPYSKANTQIVNHFRECTGCLDCGRACPVGALRIRTNPFEEHAARPSASNGRIFENKVESFEIDYAICTFCGFCIRSCPTEALGFGGDFLLASSDVQDLKVDLARQRKNKLIIKGQGPWAEI